MECCGDECTRKAICRGLCTRCYKIFLFGAHATPTYSSWKSMRKRCNNPRRKDFGSYGGKGIRVCDRWDRFENFLADMGIKPSPEYCIDRIDPDGDYCPENCRWITISDNSRRVHGCIPRAEMKAWMLSEVARTGTVPPGAVAARTFGVSDSTGVRVRREVLIQAASMLGQVA